MITIDGSSSNVLRAATLAGLGYGQQRRKVVALLGVPDSPGVKGRSDDLNWGDLSVVFQDETVLYSQISLHNELSIDLPSSLAEADAIRALPRNFAALIEELDSHGIDYALDETQPGASAISTHSPEGKAQLVFLESDLVEILFSWPDRSLTACY